MPSVYRHMVRRFPSIVASDASKTDVVRLVFYNCSWTEHLPAPILSLPDGFIIGCEFSSPAWSSSSLCPPCVALPWQRFNVTGSVIGSTAHGYSQMIGLWDSSALPRWTSSLTGFKWQITLRSECNCCALM